MQSKLKVSAQQFKSTSEAFLGSAGEVEGNINQLKAMVYDLSAHWEDDAKVEYFKKFDELYANLMKAHNLINTRGTELKQMAENYIATGEETTSQARSVETNASGMLGSGVLK